MAAVVVGFDRNINYYKIQYATLCIRENPGCMFIATNTGAGRQRERWQKAEEGTEGNSTLAARGSSAAVAAVAAASAARGMGARVLRSGKGTAC